MNSSEHMGRSAENVRSSRRILSQFLAVSVKNLLLFNSGLSNAFATILIPALTGIPNEHNGSEFLSITAVQASWIGSISYFVQPFGSFSSSLLADPLGRKRAMILVNIPYAIGWFLLYQATNVWYIFIGLIFVGAAVGLMEAPVLVFLGEICEPNVRGILIAYTYVFLTLGIFTITLLNTLMAWRTVALVCLSVPMITAIFLCFIPETPQWLLSKNRVDEAEKSLRWLRGWTSSETVAEEFNRLKKHSEFSKSCNLCVKQNIKCSHPLPTLREKLGELKRKSTLKPFAIVTALFFISQFSGVGAIKPFIVQIFKAYESPISPDRAAAIMSFTDNLSNVTFICLVRFTGKRRLYLVAAFGMFFSWLVISSYGFHYLPPGYVSFNPEQSFHVDNKDLTFIPFICLFVLSFCFTCGFNTLPWMLLSEIFSLKARGIATGLAAGLNYGMGFISRKIYYDLETALSIQGVSMLYCIICGVGFIVMSFILPETEGRTLEDIELHFSDNSKGFTDWRIAKTIQSRKQSQGLSAGSAKNDSILQVRSESTSKLEQKEPKHEASFVNKGFEMESIKE